MSNPSYWLSFRATFANALDRPVYVHSAWDSPSGTTAPAFADAATFRGQLSALDSATITGVMRLQYLIMTTPGPFTSRAQPIPDSLRSAPIFDVVPR